MDGTAGDEEGVRGVPRVTAPSMEPTPRRLSIDDLPAQLRDLSHPPAALWCLGDPSALQAPDRMVSIVGTREASAYGERIATRLAGACARTGLTVVSGLARGIDAAAHRAAMAAGGQTVAILGTGVDVPYPAGHRALHAAIQRQGAVLSEMDPGRAAFPGCFPRRNRIIAALTKMTVVVEAGFKSGAINTASQALELGRLVAAVPGQIDDPRAAGTNGLIRDGALVIADVEDLLIQYGFSTNDRSSVGRRMADDLQIPFDRGGVEGRVVGAIGAGTGRAGLLADRLGLAVGEVAGILLGLELAGVVRRVGGEYQLAERGGRGATESRHGVGNRDSRFGQDHLV